MTRRYVSDSRQARIVAKSLAIGECTISDFAPRFPSTIKYGITFGLLAVSLFLAVIAFRGWYWLALWPTISFALVAAGYSRCGPSVFGKRNDGTLGLPNRLLLLPYLLMAWTTWHGVRLCSREPAFNKINHRIYIGRRVLAHELPGDVMHVIDLTCEFVEPRAIRRLDYHSFPILDGVPAAARDFDGWLTIAASLPGTLYIHCAQGHGRTGLFAAALLVKNSQCKSVGDAIALIQALRPGAQLSADQQAFLETVEANIQPTNVVVSGEP